MTSGAWALLAVLYCWAAATVGMLSAFVPIARRRPSAIVLIGLFWPVSGFAALALILGSAWHPGPADDLPP